MHMGMFLHVLVWMGCALERVYMCACASGYAWEHVCERFVPLSTCTCVDLCVSGHEHLYLCVHV